MVDLSSDAVPCFQWMCDQTKRQVWTRDRKIRAGEGRNVPAGYKVLSVRRIENPQAWQRYASKRQALAKVGGSKYVVKTSGCTPEDGCDLLEAAGECYLFHGTTSSCATQICEQGFDVSTARDGLFGPVIYFAENWTKADEYSGGGDERSLLVCRVARGRALRSAEKTPDKSELMRSLHAELFDSIQGDRSCTSGFQEFAILDTNQAYPEYLVTYKRC